MTDGAPAVKPGFDAGYKLPDARRRSPPRKPSKRAITDWPRSVSIWMQASQ